MSNEMITQLPTVTNALLSDIIYAVQGYISPTNPGTSSQETLQQVFNLMLANTILNNAGNPNGVVAGQTYQFCVDTTNSNLYICTTSGSASSAVWTRYAGNIISPSDGGTGVANPTAHTLPVAEGSSNFHFLGPLLNGQLLIGSSGADPVPATLTAGANITISNNSGAITIASGGGSGFMWNNVTSTPITMASFNGYISNHGGTEIVYELPASSNIGDEIIIVGRAAGLWEITYGTNQYIIVGTSTSTTTTGNVTSTKASDCITLICTVANTEWTAISVQGNLTVT